MLAISAAGQYMSAPGQSYSVAAIKDPMRTGLGISETDYSLAYGAATLLSAVLLPTFGRLVDRFGARVMLPLIATGLGAACLQMSRVDSLIDLYVGFAFVRTLGQGALSLVSVWLIGEWFEHRRGMATAIAGLGGGLSVMTVPLLNNQIIEHFGWQANWMALGVAAWGILVLPGLLLIRDRPEDLGLHPDGLAPQAPSTATVADTSKAQASDVEKARRPAGPSILSYADSWTVAEAIRDPSFWKLLSVPTTSGLVGTGLVFHQVALLGQHGLLPWQALGLMTIQAGFATAMTFPIGYLTDRVPSRFILFGAMGLLAVATLLVLNLPVAWLAIVYALLLGAHGSIMRSTANVVWINYYGRAHQGAVRGVAWAMMIFGAALGPFPLAISIDHLGTYAPALYGFLALPALAAIAVWTAKPPGKPPRQRGGV
jgi:MFS family permease